MEADTICRLYGSRDLATEATVSGIKPMMDAVYSELSGFPRVYRGVGWLNHFLSGANVYGH
jgi:hypothetical protein